MENPETSSTPQNIKKMIGEIFKLSNFIKYFQETVSAK